MSELLTVAALLGKATGYLAEKGVPSPRLDAELLLAWVLGCERIDLYVHFDRPLEPGEVGRYRELVGRRAKKVPVAFLRGFKEFFALPFTVTPAVLIPRPETELLVQEVLGWLAAQGAEVTLPTGKRLSGNAADGASSLTEQAGEADPRSFTVADVATGSGCIAVSVARCAPAVQVVASDRSEQALEVARANAARHEVEDRIDFLAGDGLAPLVAAGWAHRLDALVTNPPYIPSATVDELGADVAYEPRTALDGGPDGLLFYRSWIPEAADLLRPGGLFACEIGHDQGAAVSGLLVKDGRYGDVRVLQDHGGRDRIVRAVRVVQETGP